MKNTIIILVGVCLCALLGSGYSAFGQDDMVPPGVLDLKGVRVACVLEEYIASINYKATVKTELIIATNVLDTHGITLRNEKAVTIDVARHMMEQALLKQAGVVITRLDSKRISVTFNDKLALQP